MISLISKALHSAIADYKLAKETGQFPLWLVSALAIYIPFEDWIVAWLPLPSAMGTGIRLIPELIIYVTLFKVLNRRRNSGKPIRKTPIDILIIAFILSSIISLIINQASIPGSLANLRTNWRYLSIYYMLVNIDISTEQLEGLLKTLRKVCFLQGIITSIQFFIPANLKVSFAAGGCNKAINKGASCGMFLDSALLSGFLLLMIPVFFAYAYTNSSNIIPHAKDSASILVLYFSMFASKKRAALVIALIFPILVLLYLGRKRNTVATLWLYAALGFVIVSILSSLTLNLTITPGEETEAQAGILSYFLGIFSPEYQQHNLEASRGWISSTIIDSLIKTGNWTFGFGPELGAVKTGIGSVLTNSEEIYKLQRDLNTFDDPYWFAIMAYFGIVGLIIYWLILLRLFQASQWLVRVGSNSEERSLGAMFSTIVTVTFFYSFVERLFRLRPFSFYFWLLAGLVINACYVRKQQLLSGTTNIKIKKDV